jgi:hypothetical protein
MLILIIQIQTVIEIITSKTAKYLNISAKQQTKTQNAVYHNLLAVEYLLASKSGICEKFNLSNCCLQIDEEEKIIKGIINKIKKLSHVPTQTWKDRVLMVSSGTGSALGGLKTLIGAML